MTTEETPQQHQWAYSRDVGQIGSLPAFRHDLPEFMEGVEMAHFCEQCGLADQFVRDVAKGIGGGFGRPRTFPRAVPPTCTPRAGSWNTAVEGGRAFRRPETHE